MITIPQKTKNRIIEGVKKYKPILKKARDKDINESDTVTIINNILSDIFGYEQFEEITSEFAIKKTFCDLAIKLNDEIKLLIEVKSAGLNLKEQHIRQAVDYGSNSGIDWCVLTNGLVWKVYKIIFSKPVSHELLYEFDLTEVNTRKDSDIELVYYLTKESMGKACKSSIEDYHTQKQVLNKYVISQLLLSDIILDTIRKNLKKISPELKVTNEEIHPILCNEIIKKDILDDENFKNARKKVSNALKPKLKKEDTVSTKNKEAV